MRGRRQEAAARQQHVAGEVPLARRADQRQAVAHVGDLAVGVDELVLAVAQLALVGVVQGEVGVILVVVALVQDLDLGPAQRCQHGGRIGEPDLGLHLEALLLHRAADGDQLGEHRLLARDQEGVDAAGVVLRPGRAVRLVEGEQLPVAHQPRPFTITSVTSWALAGVDQLGVDPVGSRRKRGELCDRCQVHQDQVGALARLQRADQVPHVQGARAQAGGHRQGLRRGQDGGVVAGALGQERGQAHLLEHIQVVVGGRAVGADAHGQPGLQHLLHRREAGGQLEVRGGVVGHAGTDVPQRLDLAVVDVDAVGGQHLGARRCPAS